MAATTKGLSEKAGAYGPSHEKAGEKVGDKTSVTISKETSELTREEKGVVSSVFAKVIEGKICTQNSNGSANTDEAGKCESPEASKKKLSETVGAYASGKEKSADKVGTHTSVTVSKDTAALSREEKGVVSSVFAKVIEGAEILGVER